MVTKRGGHPFLGVMSVFIFLALLANLLLPWLPVEWRHKFSPPEEAVGQVPSPEVAEQVSSPQEPLSVSEYATKADLQNILSLMDSLKATTSRVDSLKAVTVPGTSQYLTIEDLDLLEQRLAEHFVTVEHLDEVLHREIARVQNRARGSSPSSQVTIIVPAPPTRPLPHPLPGRQF